LPIRLFDGVKIVSRYLQTRHHVNPELIYEVEIKEILKLFKDNESITVTELYDHITFLYKKDNKIFTQQLKTETKNLSDNLINNAYDTSKPFGQYSEVTLNKIGVSLREYVNYIKEVN
jgi:hypothetical protein